MDKISDSDSDDCGFDSRRLHSEKMLLFALDSVTRNFEMEDHMNDVLDKLKNKNYISDFVQLLYIGIVEYLDYLNSYPFHWLNKSEREYSGILEKHLNKVETYLQKTTACLDIIDNLDNSECKTTNKENYISLLSTTDFINIGNKESFVVNDEYFYLSNSNSQNFSKHIWAFFSNNKTSVQKYAKQTN